MPSIDLRVAELVTVKSERSIGLRQTGSATAKLAGLIGHRGSAMRRWVAQIGRSVIWAAPRYLASQPVREQPQAHV